MIEEGQEPHPASVWVSIWFLLHILIQLSLAFWKIALCCFAFVKDLHYCLLLLTKTNPEKIFTFKKKGKKEKLASIHFVLQLVRAAPPSPSPGKHTQIKRPQLWTVCEHLCSLSTNSVHPLARCVLRQLLLHFNAVLTYTRFHRNTLLSESRGNLYYIMTSRGDPQSKVLGFFCLSIWCCSTTQLCLTLRAHGLQHARLSWPSPTPGAYSNSCPLSQWCHPTSYLLLSPSPPAFNPSQHPMSWFFASGGQNIGASASVLPTHNQDSGP